MPTSHPRLLIVNASSRGEQSVSRWLAARYQDAWRAAHADGEVVHRDLMDAPPPYVDLGWIGANFTPPEYRSPEQVKALRLSDTLIAELRAADRILIATPMHNLSIPAVLKTYIDIIVRIGETVSADNVGLVTGKVVDVILASGGDFSPGSPTEAYNQASGYLRAVLGWIGLTDLHIVLAGRAQVGGDADVSAERYRLDVERAAMRI